MFTNKEEFVIVDEDGKVYSKINNEYGFFDTVDEPDGGYELSVKFDDEESAQKFIDDKLEEYCEPMSVKDAFTFVKESEKKDEWRLGNISEIGAYEDFPCLLYGNFDVNWDTGEEYGMLIAFYLKEQNPNWTEYVYNFDVIYESTGFGVGDNDIDMATAKLNEDDEVRNYFPEGIPVPPVEKLKEVIK